MKIAFLGLGRMGSELVLHLIDAGHDVTVWNRSPAPADTLAAQVTDAGQSVAVAPSAADAVDGAEVVMTTLFGPDTVREVVLGGSLPFADGATWIDITTVAPTDTTEFAAWALEHDIAYAHSPVIGSLAPARARALGVLLGGRRDATDAVEPLVALWAEEGRLHIYDAPEKAATGKLVANLALAVSLQGMVEALRLGHGGGMTTEEVLSQLLDKTNLSPIATAKGDVIRDGTFTESQFSADALAKDIRLMINTADGPLPAVTSAAASLAAAIAAGHGSDDIATIARDDS